MVDIVGIGNTLFGPGVGSIIESIVGDEKLEKLRETSQVAPAGDQMTSGGQGFDLRAFVTDPMGSSVELVFAKSKELGISSEVQENGYAPSTSWNQQFANAVTALKDNFGALDTSAGLGGKDGLVGRNDLESALKNPALPQELRDACRFLLENPSAWNQLDVHAGIGEVDGFFGHCDLEAASAQLGSQQAAAGAASGVGSPVAGHGRPYTGQDESWTSGGDDLDAYYTGAGAGGVHHGYDQCQGSSTASGSSHASDGQDYAADSPWGMLEKYDSEIQGLLNNLDAATDPTEVAELMRQTQQAVEKRKLMYELISTMSRLDHEMAKTALENMGRA